MQDHMHAQCHTPRTLKRVSCTACAGCTLGQRGQSTDRSHQATGEYLAKHTHALQWHAAHGDHRSIPPHATLLAWPLRHHHVAPRVSTWRISTIANNATSQPGTWPPIHTVALAPCCHTEALVPLAGPWSLHNTQCAHTHTHTHIARGGVLLTSRLVEPSVGPRVPLPDVARLVGECLPCGFVLVEPSVLVRPPSPVCPRLLSPGAIMR